MGHIKQSLVKTAFATMWNEVAHPFNCTRESFAKVIAKVDAAIKAAA